MGPKPNAGSEDELKVKPSGLDASTSVSLGFLALLGNGGGEIIHHTTSGDEPVASSLASNSLLLQIFSTPE